MFRAVRKTVGRAVRRVAKTVTKSATKAASARNIPGSERVGSFVQNQLRTPSTSSIGTRGSSRGSSLRSIQGGGGVQGARGPPKPSRGPLVTPAESSMPVNPNAVGNTMQRNRLMGRNPIGSQRTGANAQRIGTNRSNPYSLGGPDNPYSRVVQPLQPQGAPGPARVGSTRPPTTAPSRVASVQGPPVGNTRPPTAAQSRAGTVQRAPGVGETSVKSAYGNPQRAITSGQGTSGYNTGTGARDPLSGRQINDRDFFDPYNLPDRASSMQNRPLPDIPSAPGSQYGGSVYRGNSMYGGSQGSGNVSFRSNRMSGSNRSGSRLAGGVGNGGGGGSYGGSNIGESIYSEIGKKPGIKEKLKNAGSKAGSAVKKSLPYVATGAAAVGATAAVTNSTRSGGGGDMVQTQNVNVNSGGGGGSTGESQYYYF